MGGDVVGTRGHLARTINSLVGIRFFSGDTVLFDVFESIVHKTTVATIVTVLGTVNQVLFGEGNETLTSSSESTFNSTGGGERPARTTLTLILNGGDGTLGGPVDFDTFVVQSGSRELDSLLDLQGKVHRLEFFSGEIHELGDTVIFGVGLGDLEVISENLDSVLFEIGVSELLVVLGLELSPLGLEVFVSFDLGGGTLV